MRRTTTPQTLTHVHAAATLPLPWNASRHCYCSNAPNTSCICRKVGQECTNCVAKCENCASKNILQGSDAIPSQSTMHYSTWHSLRNRSPLATLATPARPADNTAHTSHSRTLRPAADYTTPTAATPTVKGSTLSPGLMRPCTGGALQSRPLMRHNPPIQSGGVGEDRGGQDSCFRIGRVQSGSLSSTRI